MNAPVFNPREVDLSRLNAITKYPSIPTYHTLNKEKHILLDEAVLFEWQVIATEQINGVNARVMLCPDGTYLIGSRTSFLFGKGDLVGNPEDGIVDILWDWAESLDFLHLLTHPLVIYLELFGGDDLGSQPQSYAGRGDIDFRIIDIAEFPTDQLYEMLDWNGTRIAIWRESGQQKWDREEQLVGRVAGGKLAPLAPRLFRMDANQIPRTVEDMAAMLTARLPKTNVGLDDDATLVPEGIVFRTPDRKKIAKATIANYSYTLKQRMANK